MKRLVLLCVVSCSHNNAGVATLVASNVAIVCDSIQTIHATQQWSMWYERNPLIRDARPEVIVAYGTVAILTNTLVWWMLPDRWRPIWGAGITGMEGATVVSNALGAGRQHPYLCW